MNENLPTPGLTAARSAPSYSIGPAPPWISAVWRRRWFSS